ncbi:protein Son-like isoform X1 [Prorops nasuta]|uniref:protein Son-like isoform X1 n=1 Tax=Prorops nasuta TaxID=863751 RepID=UPI0034CE88C4
MTDLFDIANLITTVGVDAVKIKPEPGLPEKSSSEILTELFSTFDVDEGIVSSENSDQQVPDTEVKNEKHSVKKKKSKKKHKHKEKKHKKRSKHNSSDSNSDTEISDTKKKKKHKKKSKRKHESNKVLDMDEPKNKVSKLKINCDNKEEPDHDESIVQNSNGAKLQLENNFSSNFLNERLGSPKLPPIPKKVKDNSDETIIPKILDKSKPTTQGKILIKDLKNSTVYNDAIKQVEKKKKAKDARMEDGELSDSSSEDRTLTLSPIPPPNLERMKEKLLSPPLKSSKNHDLRMILKEKEKKRVKQSKSKIHQKEHKDQLESNSRDRKHSRSCYSSERKYSNSPARSNSGHSRSRGKDRQRGRSKERYEHCRSREKCSRSRGRRYRSPSNERSKDKYRHRSRSKSRERKNSIEIDKKKLLEIARKNAINIINQGALPLAQKDKAIAAIQAGGKTVDELTDFCKSLSKSEALGELSNISSDDDGSESEIGFHHPFLLKERPSSIIMNIRDAKQLPTKTFQEKTAESSNQLRLQFPVSSGQHHRKSENEWIPVVPKTTESKKTFIPAIAPTEPFAALPQSIRLSTPVPSPSVPNTVFPVQFPAETVDIGSIVSQRLAAMRKLRENPNDVYALNEMYKAQKEMTNWAKSKQMPGQFTGSTGAKMLTPAELTSGYQAWARKDQLVSAQPLTGGMGMALLQKMGWRPGEGLGKNKEGTLVPLQLEVKLDKKGLVSEQDVGPKTNKVVKSITPTIKTLEGKHPVSLLGEYCSKRKYGAPVYELCFECGPDHKKMFLFKGSPNGSIHLIVLRAPPPPRAKSPPENQPLLQACKAQQFRAVCLK